MTENYEHTSDDEYSDSSTHILSTYSKRKLSPEYKLLERFLAKPEYAVTEKDKEYNICNRENGKKYFIPNDKIYKFFDLLKGCYDAKIETMFEEFQRDNEAFMLDFDIKQQHPYEQTQIDEMIYAKCCKYVMTTISDVLHLDKKLYEFKVMFTKRPKLTMTEDKVNGGTYYKDGFHMIIPELRITKRTKAFILDIIQKNYLREYIFTHFNEDPKRPITTFLDRNSSFVPVFFVGCATKPGKQAYKVAKIYNVSVDTRSEKTEIYPTEFKIDETWNLQHEFSVGFERDPAKNGKLLKTTYIVREELERKVNDTVVKQINYDSIDDPELIELLDQDIQSKYIRALLDCLKPSRYDNYDEWFKVGCILSNLSLRYKVLWHYFSKKSKKYDKNSVDDQWENYKFNKGNQQKSLSIGSLIHWAREDNPEQFQDANHQNISHVIGSIVYGDYNNGELQHYDYVDIIKIMAGNRYKVDIPPGETNFIWYEFVTENTSTNGEYYKWKRWDTIPPSFRDFLHTELHRKFINVLNMLKKKCDDASDPGAKKGHDIIFKNFKRSCNRLRNIDGISSISRACETAFQDLGFASLLDSDPYIMGVGNGVLDLDVKKNGRVLFINRHHNYPVSLSTKVNFIPFDPRNIKTARLLKALRNMVSADEPDTFEWMMMYLASTLDGAEKAALFVMMIGQGQNGKSLLLELHKTTIGESYGVKMPLSILTDFKSNSEGATPALMQLKNARLAHYSESNRNEVLNIARIKEWTGGETLAGRKLHKDIINFKPKAHHLVTTNNTFEIPGSDWGSWRRIVLISMKIKFSPEKDYNPEDPYNRLIDPELKNATNDSGYLSSYLSILTFYYEKLQKMYDGDLEKVPRPHIDEDTQKYREDQDSLNKFINRRCVKIVDQNELYPLTQAMDEYKIWYKSNYGDNKIAFKGLGEQFKNSAISKYIMLYKGTEYIKGYKMLAGHNEPDDGEIRWGELYKVKSSNKPETKLYETTDDFYTRIVKEYDENKFVEQEDFKKLKAEQEKLEEMRKLQEEQYYQETMSYQREDNIDINPEELLKQCNEYMTAKQKKEKMKKEKQDQELLDLADIIDEAELDDFEVVDSENQ